MNEVRFLSTGMIGTGVSEAALRAGMELEPHFIASDAGSSDGGPFWLGSGLAEYGRNAIKNDLRVVLGLGRSVDIPVIIGSAGTAGGDLQVNWVLDIIRELADEDGFEMSGAVIYAEQSPDYLISMLRDGRLRELSPAPHVDEDTLRNNTHTVAMMGVEPIQEAVRQDVNFVLGGRASDAALFAALPIMHGLPAGLAWHAGKTVECNTHCCVERRKGAMFAKVTHDHFTVRPLGEGLRCSPQSVAAHSLYEHDDPYLLYEPSGALDLTGCSYEQEDEISVRVSGSVFRESGEYTVKLEGSALAGYGAALVAGIRDPFFLGQLDPWLDGVRVEIERSVQANLGLSTNEYGLAFHVYGRDGVMGDLESDRRETPKEVGIVFETVADTQEAATNIAKLMIQPPLHRPIPEWSGSITSCAWLFNPPYLERGPVYRFTLNHVVVPHSKEEMFRTEVLTVGAKPDAVKTLSS